MGNDDKLRYLVLLADSLLLAGVLIAYYFFIQWLSPAWVNGFRLDILVPTYLIAFWLASYFYPSVSQNRMITPEAVVRRSIGTTLLLLLFIGIFVTATRPGIRFPRMFTYVFILVFMIMLTTERLLIRKLFIRLRQGQRNLKHAVFIGYNPHLIDLYKYISSSIFGYHISAVFCDAEAELPEDMAKLRLGTEDDAYPWLVQHPEVSEVYASYADDNQDSVAFMSKYCDNHLARFFYVPQLNLFNGNFYFNRIGSVPVVARREEPLRKMSNRLVKRGFDFIASSLFLGTVYPFILLWVSIMIRRQSPGPIYFKQERTGLDGKVFHCIKFRSMHVNAQSDTQQATEHDPRKFPFGDFMRRTNIDELPQLINVWLGEMSLVGPRPHMLRHTEQYSQIVNRFMVRHLVKPGLTGLAQVSGYRGETRYIEQMEGRVRMDIEYIENWNFLLDLRIIYKTLFNMIVGDKNAY